MTTAFDGKPGISLHTSRRDVLGLAAVGALASVARPLQAAEADQQMTIGVHISLAPTWFDPAETAGIITPFLVLYALHDAMLKPMPGQNPAPCLAESWTASPDGMTYSFVLRPGVTFHNGEKVTAEDVKFSFERYRGAEHATLKGRVASVDIPEPGHVRFSLKEPWPDFLTFYGSATGAGWIVPKQYVEKVGDDGFKRAPIGAGPYKFVSFNPGVELVLEAHEQYWRKTPAVKRIVMRVIPDEATRLAALKRGEVDMALSIRAELAEEVQRTPGLTLKAPVGSAPYWMYFPEQWDPKSPWYDVRVRRAARLAIDRKSINQALTLGFSHLTNSAFPENFEFFWQPPPPQYDPEQARHLLAEAGFPNGFDAGFYTCDSAYANLGEAVLDNLGAVGIRARLRPLERASFFAGYGDKKFKNIIQGASGAFGNLATRLEAFVVKGGSYAYGNYPEIDELFARQATELDRAKREELLFKIQQIAHDKAIYTPIWQLAFISGVGPRVAQSSFGLIKGFVYPAPYEELALKGA
ncbi:MAG TPA: ABC transporter substrate-binding protein [Acetobacteraceae bacterium]|jgi:peptide/nickel transport system substrate-binding protein|nr:ABC transporter substrate-binding protein [Acetobacteraceae bacterium]